jgi:hypothetical protein
MTSESFKPHFDVWDSREILGPLSAEDFTATQDVRDSVKHDLWGDMCAEYDARNLFSWINDSGLVLSEETTETLSYWYKDEVNHYQGLRLICSCMYNHEEHEIDRMMAERKPDFSNIVHLISDEFSLLITLAYDELVSALGYKMFVPDFEKFGPKSTVDWVLKASRDEGLHYYNFTKIALVNYSERKKEVSGILDSILEYESSTELSYRNTFLLDHTPETFTRDFLKGCANRVKQKFI